MRFCSDNLLLYAVTDRKWLNGRTLLQQVSDAIDGGVTMIQLREKNLGYDEFLCEAVEINRLCKRKNVPFIVNDSVEIAVKSGADGVHLGQSDEDVRHVREKYGDSLIIGATARTIEQARAAQMSGADYLGVGAVFGTSTKADAKPMSIEHLSEICSCVNIPVVAIGGINGYNIMELKDSGAVGAAVVSAIFSADDTCAAAHDLRKKAEKAFR